MKVVRSERGLDHQRVRSTQRSVLVISPLIEDHISVVPLFRASNWKVRGIASCREVINLMHENIPVVIVCERYLPDGAWKDVLEASTSFAIPPALIVTSGVADECLWAEVLNLGGWDVLAKPLQRNELLWVIDSAWQRWRQRSFLHSPLSGCH